MLSKLKLSKNMVAVLILWAAVFLTYSNSFSISFQFDDTHTVQSNVAVRSLKNIPRFFVDASTSSYRPENSGYRPMTTTALALGFALSGLDTWGYHFIKLVEHALAATLLFLIAQIFLKKSSTHYFWISFFSALIFGVHRANTETVNYICAISSLQAGLFYILAFFWYLKSHENKKQRIFFIAGSVFSYFLGNLSKEEAITLPAMIFLCEWMFFLPLQKKASHYKHLFWLLFPYLIFAAVYLVLRTSIPLPIADTSRGNIPTWTYFITQFRSWIYYWKLFFWPIEMNADNLAFGFSESIFETRVLAALLVHFVIWGLAFVFRKKWPLYAFAVAWMYVTVTPASSVFRLVEAVNDHRMYIPYFFLSILSVGLFFQIRRVAIKAKLIVLAVLSVSLAWGAYQRNEVWQTDLSLWEDVYQKDPNSPRAMNVLGVTLINHGDLSRANRLLEQCHQISPTYLPCIVHLGIAYAQLKKYDDGLALLKKGLQLSPDYIHLNFHIGAYYKEYFGNFELAKKHLSRARELSGGRFFQASTKLAEIYMEEKDLQTADSILNDLLKFDPTNGDGWETYAKLLRLKGDNKGFLQVVTRLLMFVPDNFRYHLLLGDYYETQGQLSLSIKHYQQAISISPHSIQAWLGLSRTQEKMGNLAQHKEALAKIDELKQNNTWVFVPSLFLVGEKPKQIKP